MQFSTKIDGFKQKDSQGFENSYNSYEQYPLEKFFIFTIYQNYTLALNDYDGIWIHVIVIEHMHLFSLIIAILSIMECSAFSCLFHVYTLQIYS